MNKMRILMLTTQLGYGGAETSFIRLANFLSQNNEVTVALFTPTYGKGAYAEGHEKLQAQVVVLDAPEGQGRFRRWLHRICRFRALKAQHAVAISFLSGPNCINVLAGFLGRTVVSLRGSRRFDPLMPRPLNLLYRYLLDPLVYALAARIVPVSEGLIAEISSSARHKAVVIPPFFLTSEWEQKMKTSVPEKFAPLRGQQVIVATGRCSPEKGFQHLIPVVAELSLRLPGVKLLLIGDGPLLPHLKALASQKGLAIDSMEPGASSVIFAGYQDNTFPFLQLGKLYAMASATEGLPNVVLEAMYAGVPVIAANTPWGARAILHPDMGLPEVFVPYPTLQPQQTPYGVLMPRIDSQLYEEEWVHTLYTLLTKPVGFVSAAHARVQEFSLAVIGPKWEKIIHATSQGN